MCGIAGQVAINKNVKLDNQNLDEMLKVIVHRGPDGMGKYIDPNIHMGMRRLSIIDLEGGWQPVYNEDKTIAVVFNGEIYNYKELRNILINKGHVFSTNSDTEVIVHLYEEYGENFIKYLNGMFAISLHDKSANKVLLIRDRLGIKPFYYYLKGNVLYFSSEIKSILQCKGVERTVDIVAMNHYLSYNYVPSPYTMFKGIKKLKPGNYIRITEGNLNEIEYWDVPLNISNNKSEDELIDEYNNILDDAVKLRLRSDVPVGAFLSGGLDSSTIVAKTKSILKKPFYTFSIGFGETEYSELPYSEMVSKEFGTNHMTKVVKPNLIEELPKAIWHCDNPHGDVSFMPTNTVSKLAATKVKVVLTGDGGDELFGGYDKYKEISCFDTKEEDYREYFEKVSVYNLEAKETLYSQPYKDLLAEEIDSFNIINEYFEKAKNESADFLNHILYSEIKLLLEGNNLVKPDRMGMAESIEARVPFLDYRMVEFAARIPSKLKINRNQTKYLMKKAAEDFLPNEIIYRKKQMFTVPIGEWFKKDLKDLTYNVLLDEKTLNRGYFNREAIEQLLDEHMNNKKDRTRELRSLLILEIWHRMFIDNLYSNPPTLEQLGIKI
ncbi:asparagine synthase (glutamine-hydrolyzing) [Bacillus sp. JJ1533]|uniref:asparagine synthase (glutamine-hydrolyzing) n=1 Tax=Bacillus sp. JJ1533 TaxID=3122959 RepID=UPI0030008BB8